MVYLGTKNQKTQNYVTKPISNFFQVENLTDLYLHMEKIHDKFIAPDDLTVLQTKFKIYM